MSSDHAPPLLSQYKGNQKKNIRISHYTKLRQKPENSQRKKQKVAIPYAQFFRILWQSEECNIKLF